MATLDITDLPDGRYPLLLGRNNHKQPHGLGLPLLSPGQGCILPLKGAVLIYGPDEAGEKLACLWAAMHWSGEVPCAPLLITEAQCEMPLQVDATPTTLEWPQACAWQCLSQTFTVNGILGTSDGLFPDDTTVDFVLNPTLSLPILANVCDFAARIGHESTGLRMPVTGGSGRQIRIGLDEDDGWVRLCKEGLSVGAGPNLARLLGYLSRHFPTMPAENAASGYDLRAVSDELAQSALPETDIIYEATWQEQGEQARFLQQWQEEILPSLAAPATGLAVVVTISEPREVRVSLGKEIEKTLATAGFADSVVVVRPAFKQAYYWLTEEILPQLAPVAVDKVVIQWRPLQLENVRDLPIRWLQEVYPADEILRQELTVPVEFSPSLPDAEHALRIVAYQQQEIVFADSMTPTAALRPYLDGHPSEGQACHPTGWVRVDTAEGENLISQRLATDLELFWHWYSTQVLTEIEGLVGDTEPLFYELNVEYTGSEPEEKLGVRQESGSTLEALHEEIYFTTLDRFAALGEARTGTPFSAPGAVLPWLRSVTGATPHASVVLREKIPLQNKPCYITGVHLTSQLATEENVFTWSPPAVKEEKLSVPGAPLTLADVRAQLSRLATATSEANVSIAARSMAGNPVYVIELFRNSGELTSRAKAMLARPTLLINARHHANEVSSSSAVLALADKLVKNPAILAQVNVVIIPLENVDGAEIHQKMATENPAWILHAARYNRVGSEYYSEYFNADTLFGEAKALARLWQAWLPDVVLDAHGIPSHEWVQYFSGYGSPPRFAMSFWLPNALFYPILWGTTADKNYTLGLDLVRTINGAIKQNTRIHELNQLWLERYRTYGHNNLPDSFPISLLDDAIYYERNDHAKISFAGRHPAVTAVHLVTEVADETNRDEDLQLSADAHRTAQEAIISWLSSWDKEQEEVIESVDGYIRRRRRRLRPQEEG
ncbi:MAG: M14 family metallopeptidase [Firmicutes bacterium]|nr:M14 family metallopeptidase [Bacillota bacterium]